MHYEINVARQGVHLFATHERSLFTKEKTTALWRELKRAFPPPLHTITVSKIETTGTDVTGEML